MAQEKALKFSLDEGEGVQIFEWVLRCFPCILIPAAGGLFMCLNNDYIK